MTIEEYQAGFTTQNQEWILGYVQQNRIIPRRKPCIFWDYGQGGSVDPYRLLSPSTHFLDILIDDPRALYVPHPTIEGKFAS